MTESKEHMSEMSSPHVVLFVDSSGSMEIIKDAMIKGVTDFINDQKNQECYITLVTFSDEIMIGEKKLASEYKEFIYKPEGSTALYDAFGKVFTKFADESKILIIVVTDGKDNASEFHTRAETFKKIREYKTKGWEFVYLGANQDSFEEAAKMGINSSANFCATPLGVSRIMRQCSATASNYITRNTPHKSK